MPKKKSTPENAELTQYDSVILEVFNRYYHPGLKRLVFPKDDLAEACQKHGMTIRNIPDIVYTYRSRRTLPPAILAKGHWAIEPAGRSKYAFRLLNQPPHFKIAFDEFEPIEIPNALPEVVEGLLREDEQSLLTRILYNRLVDIFTELTCFHIQNHYRSFVAEVGEVELDSLYVGMDRTGQLTILPIEAKSVGQNEFIGRIQVSQMVSLMRQDFPNMAHRVLAVKPLSDGTVGMAEFSDTTDPDESRVISVARFRLIRRAPK